MGMEPSISPPIPTPAWCLITVVGSIVVGLALMSDQAVRLSATYDEVTYLEVGARWWRTGEQDWITRMGSPLTFWKVQQAPTLWALDRLGLGAWIDDPIGHQEELLPIIRIGGLWIWVVRCSWSRPTGPTAPGPRGMAMAAAPLRAQPELARSRLAHDDGTAARRRARRPCFTASGAS